MDKDKNIQAIFKIQKIVKINLFSLDASLGIPISADVSIYEGIGEDKLYLKTIHADLNRDSYSMDYTINVSDFDALTFVIDKFQYNGMAAEQAGKCTVSAFANSNLYDKNFIKSERLKYKDGFSMVFYSKHHWVQDSYDGEPPVDKWVNLTSVKIMFTREVN